MNPSDAVADATADARSEVIADVDARLRAAYRSGVPVAPVRDVLGPGDIDAAYAVQLRSTAAWIAEGRRIVGRKIGLTNPVVQTQLGVDQPDFGVLFDDMAIADGASVPVGQVLQARVEAEIAFVFDADVDDPDITLDRLRPLVRSIRPALEIVGSRIADWKIGIVDTVADNGSSGAFVLGGNAVSIDGFDLEGAVMAMTRNSEPVSKGQGSACLGSPLLAAQWLARELSRRGTPLRAGDIVLTGALGPMVDARPGDEFTAEISGLGAVSCRFATNS